MKKTSKLILAVTIFIPLLSYANNNEPHMYMGLLYSYASVDIDGKIKNTTNNTEQSGSVDFNNSLVGLSFGYQFHKHFALEARGYGSVNDDRIGDYKVKVSNHFNVLAKAILPIDQEYFRIYGILGYGKTKLKVAGVSDSDSDFLYGAGFSISNHNPVSIDIEWIRAYDESSSGSIAKDQVVYADIMGDMFNVNLVYHFK